MENPRELESLENVWSNNSQLFADMLQYNKFAKEYIDKFRNVVNSLSI